MNEDDQQPQNANAADPLTGEHGTAAAMVATLDQHSAEIDALNSLVMVQWFALGALAGIVFLLARNLKELQGAFAD